VIARAMVRDLFTPAETPRIYAALMLVMGVAPMLAPLLGGYVLVGFGWTAIFWILAALGVGCLLAVLRLPETQPADSVRPLAFGRIIADYASLLGHRAFLGYTLAGAVSLAGMFAYIAGSPFVFIELYHVPAEHYGWLFGINAFGIIAASQISAQLVKRWGPGAMLHGGCLVQAVAGVTILGAAATGLGGLSGIAVPLFVYVSTVGFVMPNATALAMAPHGRAAGIASALLGTLQFVIAAIAATLVGVLNNGTALPMACVIAGCGLLGFVLYRILVGYPSRPIGAAPS
jgi:DHA1 family bicyclomycin/chloramphenicol resistance-like MFS transporter